MAKGRDSGMPPTEQWESYFDIPGILRALGCGDLPGDVIELGCGYGSFTLEAARRIMGTVYTFDIDPLMVAATSARARAAGLHNVIVAERDFLEAGCGQPDGSASFAMLFNILHIEDPVSLLREARRVLCGGGIAGVIHWKHDANTPRGPALEIRPKPEQIRLWASEAGFQRAKITDLPGSPWHFGMTLEAPRSGSMS